MSIYMSQFRDSYVIISRHINHDRWSEEYEYLDDAVDSKSFDNLCTAYSMLQIYINSMDGNSDL